MTESVHRTFTIAASGTTLTWRLSVEPTKRARRAGVVEANSFDVILELLEPDACEQMAFEFMREAPPP